MRVPICTPSAPSANAAAIDGPSQMPPAAMIGTSTAARTAGSSTIVAAPFGSLNPPPSAPFDHQAVHAGVDRLVGGGHRRHDVEHGEAGAPSAPTV